MRSQLVSVDALSLVGDAGLRQLLGVPTDVLLKTVISSEPPPLPTPHLSRASIFSQLAKVFDSHRIAAVTGYPESGKTVALAEFASAYPGDVFWYSVAHSETHPDAWFALFCYALAQFLGAKSLLASDIRAGLIARQKPLLVVLDNAQHCDTLDGLSFLFEAAEASPSISVLLVGIDDPAFLSAVRGRGIIDWRLPGLTEREAQALIELTGGSLSSDQSHALEVVRARVDGHLGMLRLSRSAVRNIESAEQRDAFIARMFSALGPGLDSLQSAMIERLRSGLHDEEIELCRRLSLVLGTFPRRVAERVWTVDRSQEQFHTTWNGCVVGVFETQPSGKFSLPDLYRDGFRKEAKQELVPSFHAAIADAFQEREGRSVDIFDIHAAVVHRVLSGDVAAALESAAMYLAFASGPHARSAQDFLIRRFEIWLAGVGQRADLPIPLRIRWHAIRARVYTDLNLSAKAKSAIDELLTLLHQSPADVPRDAIALGWSIVLMHASNSGEPQMAISAAQHLETIPPELTGVTSRFSPFLVISSFLKSSASPLPYLRALLAKCKSGTHKSPLWSEMTGYEFWRLVSMTLYSRSRDETREHHSATLVEDIGNLAADFHAIGEPEVHCLMNCLLVHIHIDVRRDFTTATTIAEHTVKLLTPTMDVRVVAYVHDTLGDALRCSGRDQEAVTSYIRAIELWPEPEIPDRAETLMMLGIAEAKFGRFFEGAKAARAAAQLHLRGNKAIGVGPSKISAARCLLEAGSSLIHGNGYAQSLRCLVQAHSLLKDLIDNAAEWAALGQIAWSLTNRNNPDPNDPQPPVPGFTLGLGDTLVGAEHMVKSAPTMMLARACASLGRTHRAMCYFDSALAECEALDMRTHLGIMALDAAIEAEEVMAAAKYATIGSDLLSHPLPNAPQGSHPFVFDYLIGRAVRLASAHFTKDRPPEVIQRAQAAVSESGLDNQASRLFATVLNAFYRAKMLSDASSLEDVYRLACDNRALWVAREIAWFWCYVFGPGQKLYETDYFLWHWRLCAMSMEIAPQDLVFLGNVSEQEKDFWTRIPEDSRTDGIQRIVKAVESNDAPQPLLRRITSELAAVVCSMCNASDASLEMATQLSFTSDATLLTEAIDALYIRLLNLLLHPGAPHLQLTLQTDIGGIVTGIQKSRGLEPREVERCFGLEALSQFLASQEPTAKAFEALRTACSRAPELSTNSSAQVYIWMRHLVQYAPPDFRFDKVSDILRSQHVAELLLRDDLMPYLRVRLAVCHLTAKGFNAQQRLAHALTAIASQHQMRAPIATTAIIGAEKERDRALAELKVICAEFESLEMQARDAGLNTELWSCCNELGGLRRMAGTILLLQSGDEAATDAWLSPAVDDFRRAIEAAKLWETEERSELVIKSAFSGRSVAIRIQDQPAVDEFSAEIEGIRAEGGFDRLIAEQESIEANDLPARKDNSRQGGRGVVRHDDEESIQYFTNHIMQSTGWPSDRRRFVEDDVRKMARIEKEQDEYCQHLQPLQNLLHTRSSRTVYASATEYTCSCTLLGYKTQIETTDIETVIDAMKRVYCNECNRRSPRQPVVTQ